MIKWWEEYSNRWLEKSPHSLWLLMAVCGFVSITWAPTPSARLFATGLFTFGVCWSAAGVTQNVNTAKEVIDQYHVLEGLYKTRNELAESQIDLLEGQLTLLEEQVEYYREEAKANAKV